jgi:hypothetical protein
LTATLVLIIAFIAAAPVDIDDIGEPVFYSLLYEATLFMVLLFLLPQLLVCFLTQQHLLMNGYTMVVLIYELIILHFLLDNF